MRKSACKKRLFGILLSIIMPGLSTNPQDTKPPRSGKIGVAVWFVIITLALALLLDYFLWGVLGMDPLVAWLIAINLIGMLTYYLNYLYIETDYPTLPDVVFLVQTIIGGVISTLFALLILRNKIAKHIFRRYLLWIILAQIGVVITYLLLF